MLTAGLHVHFMFIINRFRAVQIGLLMGIIYASLCSYRYSWQLYKMFCWIERLSRTHVLPWRLSSKLFKGVALVANSIGSISGLGMRGNSVERHEVKTL